MVDGRGPKRKRGSAPGPFSPRVQKGQAVPRGAVPRAQRPADLQDGHPSFSLRWADRSYVGSWSWCTAAEAAELLHFIADMEQLTWTEVAAQQTGGRNRHRKHHEQPVDSLSKEAQDRLAALRYDETFGDTIYRFRLGNKVRLWGFVLDGTFFILWWDRDHRVYPTEKD